MINRGLMLPYQWKTQWCQKQPLFALEEEQQRRSSRNIFLSSLLSRNWKTKCMHSFGEGIIMLSTLSLILYFKIRYLFACFRPSECSHSLYWRFVQPYTSIYKWDIASIFTNFTCFLFQLWRFCFYSLREASKNAFNCENPTLESTQMTTCIKVIKEIRNTMIGFGV